jgi:hypothetical protein
MNQLVHIAAYGSPALVEAAGERAQERGPAALTQCWPARRGTPCVSHMERPHETPETDPKSPLRPAAVSGTCLS